MWGSGSATDRLRAFLRSKSRTARDSLKIAGFRAGLQRITIPGGSSHAHRDPGRTFRPERGPCHWRVVSAIHPSTTFERDVDGGYDRGHLYARNSNPNRDALEHCLADLEGGLAAAAFGSGTAATMAVFQALAPGDHVIAPHDLYSGTARLLSEHMSRWGLDVAFADATRPGDVQAALRA